MDWHNFVADPDPTFYADPDPTTTPKFYACRTIRNLYFDFYQLECQFSLLYHQRHRLIGVIVLDGIFIEIFWEKI